MSENHLSHFKNPPSEFRGKPFWAWNCKLDSSQVLKQLEYFKQMGLGGATIHCRTGLDTEYMGEEFMDIVSACTQKAKEMDLQICLYDEDRWPSGFGGGKVTEDPRFRSRFLLFTPTPLEAEAALLARYDIFLKDGFLTAYRRLQEGETGENVWYAYLKISEDTPWFNNQSYVNALDKAALEKFIEVTHEPYYNLLGDEFGGMIPSIFTDEPQFVIKTSLGRADDRTEVILPYTDDFEETYQARYQQGFLDFLPEVFWQLPGDRVSLTRYRYHDHVAERFAEAFSDTLGNWCRQHNIKLTGHMMEEPTLESQTAALGEAMRHYRGFQIPGIDMLCDWREYTTAKQAQSAAHQMGVNQVLSELYGVTNWDFDFRGHKLQGDWQAALGVTERVHHLSWMSMAGEAKRDYPASIFYQSPWYQKYHEMETYFARVNTALRSGTPNVKIGVIHPIESYWLYFGPQEQTAMIREKLEQQFSQITEWLLFGLLDFDFVSETLLLDLNHLESAEDGFSAGEMQYTVILVPGCITLRQSTLDRLQAFRQKGGQVIFVGDLPTHIDAVPNGEAAVLAHRCTRVEFDETAVLNALSPYRQIDIRDQKGVRSQQLVSQLRDLGEDKILFLANAKPTRNIDLPTGECYTVSIDGDYQVTVLNAISGTEQAAETVLENGKTKLVHTFYEEDSLLLYCSKRKAPAASQQTTGHSYKSVAKTLCLNKVASYYTSEPNVLLLDQAEYALDDEAFRPSDEVLRLDNALRRELQIPIRMKFWAQPWVNADHTKPVHRLTLRYRILSELTIPTVHLAMEGLEEAALTLNGVPQNGKIRNYFVDEAIKTTLLTGIQQGENVLEVSMPYGKKTNVEWAYLLGDFGVEVFGNRAKLVQAPKQLGFSDLTMQKHPFFAGNMTYCVNLDVEPGVYELQICKYRAALLSVSLDGQEVGNIIFAPYSLPLGKLSGKHHLEITAYGNRVNAFGPVHLSDEKETWIGPDSWRSKDAAYSYEYQLKRFGILSAPQLHQMSEPNE